MKFDVVSVSSHQKRLEFTVPPEMVKAELDKAFLEVGSKARLHGFRPGKVPRPVLEARFGEQIRSDVASTLIQQGYAEALDAHKLEPVARPQVQDRGDLTPQADFRFTITVEVRPDVVLDQYLDLEVVYPPAEVTDAEVDAQVASRLEGQARLVEVTDRGVVAGDLVLVEFVVKNGDEVVAQEAGTMIRTAGDPYYKGIEDGLVGQTIGEERSFEATFAADARTESVAGKTLTVTAKVMSIQATQVPELTDAIAADLGYEGGVEGMRLALRMNLQGSRDAMARNQARANLLQVLIDRNKFTVPTGMIESHLQMLMDELKLQQAYRGRDPERIRFSPEQMADLRLRAEFAAKGGLILDAVGKKERIEVTDTDLEAKYQELADQRGQSVEAIKGYFIKYNAVEELRARMLEEKTLDWLLERSKLVSEGTVPPMKSQFDVEGESAG